MELEPDDLRNFIALFRAVAEGDGRAAGRLMWERAPKQRCEDPSAFMSDMADLVHRWVGAVRAGGDARATKTAQLNLAEVQIGSVLQEVMALVRKHQVQIDPAFTSLVTSMVIVEGIGRQLVPDLDLFRLGMPMLMGASGASLARAALS